MCCRLIFQHTFLGQKQAAELAERRALERELAKVSIKKEDVDLIADEMEISKTKAERTLREHQGNVVQALASLTN
jgi:NACalpha-BTF3-like transcription factor